MAGRQSKILGIPMEVSSATAPSISLSFASVTKVRETIPIGPSPAAGKEVPDEIAQKAVYNHLRFLKSLGKLDVRVDEVAKALSLPPTQVQRVAAKLAPRGVRLES